MAADGDIRAPGGAITVALCGHWDHEPPCPLAEHHTTAERVGDEVRLRIAFQTEPEREARGPRARSKRRSPRGRLAGPDGRESRWQISH